MTSPLVMFTLCQALFLFEYSGHFQLNIDWLKYPLPTPSITKECMATVERFQTLEEECENAASLHCRVLEEPGSFPGEMVCS